MNVADMLRVLAERLSDSATVKSVYGDPITFGDRTVVPVAEVKYAFGGGGGALAGEDAPNGGGGGGGKALARPLGALEITQTGTRFIAFDDPRKLGRILALGIAAGIVLALLTRSKKIENQT